MRIFLALMETGDRGKCDPKDWVFSSQSRDMLIYELLTVSPVSTAHANEG